MGTLLEYLKTVQAHEVDVYISDQLSAYILLKLNHLKSQRHTFTTSVKQSYQNQKSEYEKKVVTLKKEVENQENRIKNYDAILDEHKNEVESEAQKRYPISQFSLLGKILGFIFVDIPGAILFLPFFMLDSLFRFHGALFIATVINALCFWAAWVNEANTVLMISKGIFLAIGCAALIMAIHTLFLAPQKKRKENIEKQKEYIEQEIKKIPTLEQEQEKLVKLQNELDQLSKKGAPEFYCPDTYQQEIEQYTAAFTSVRSFNDALKQNLSKLYALNVIHPKYRSLVPVSMFCEYVETGRCSELTGHEGAYNIYEAELRQNVIIDQLDSIKDKLDDVKKNQYYLATTLGQGLARLQRAQSDNMHTLNNLISDNTAQYTALKDNTARLLRDGVNISGTIVHKIET